MKNLFIGFFYKSKYILSLALLCFAIFVTDIVWADVNKEPQKQRREYDFTPTPPFSTEKVRNILLENSRKEKGVYPWFIHGRDDVVDDKLKKEYLSLSLESRRWFMASLSVVGNTHWKEQEKWITSEKVVEFYVWALEQAAEPSLQKTIVIFILRCPDSLIRPYAGRLLISINKDTNLYNVALLLGKIGGNEAKELLLKNETIAKQNPVATKLALAKLGDTYLTDQYIATFKATKGAGLVSIKSFEEKAAAAKDLGYIGSEVCAKVLGQAIRDGESFIGRNSAVSIRVNIIDALSDIYPDEPLFWKMHSWNKPYEDSYYEKIEQWLTHKFGLSWENPRPSFLYME